MEYVIKDKRNGPRYVQLENGGPGFSYQYTHEGATTFGTLDAAVQAIVARTLYMGQLASAEMDRFTIVGIKKVTAPRYEEVAL